MNPYFINKRHRGTPYIKKEKKEHKFLNKEREVGRKEKEEVCKILTSSHENPLYAHQVITIRISGPQTL